MISTGDLLSAMSARIRELAVERSLGIVDKVFAKRGKGRNVEAHLGKEELACFLAVAYEQGFEDGLATRVQAENAGELRAPVKYPPGVMATLAELYQCATSWESEARLLGNVRADDMAQALLYATEALRLFAEPEDVTPAPEVQR